MRKTVALVGMVPLMLACSTPTSEGSRGALQARDNSGPLTDVGVRPTCALSQTSTIPNVHIEFPNNDCVFSLAQARAGISIRYNVVIDADTPFTPASPYFYLPGPAPREPGKAVYNWASALDPNERLEGNGQSYCLCDQGFPLSLSCPADDGGIYSPSQDRCRSVILVHGIYPGAFYWDGVNWNGPSDTGNPKGAPFPAGDYTLTVSTAEGLADTSSDAAPRTVEASARYLVRLVP